MIMRVWGDWDVNHDKLPGGIPALVKAAKDADVKFGIWIEPEMVNPKSELFEKHPDWAITLPNRETYYYRNQLVLDLSNPKVQDYVYGVVAEQSEGAVLNFLYSKGIAKSTPTRQGLKSIRLLGLPRIRLMEWAIV